jgi:AmmeMemoRadiSam system protein A
MAPSPSAEPADALDAAERAALGRIARAALVAAVEPRPGRPGVDPPAALPRLARPGASFVTLHAGGELRGCIGSIEPRRPLAEDVAVNARAAALEDPRFAPVGPDELAGLELEISVLSPLEPIAARSRAELLATLRPGVDGLLITDGSSRATFLPAVWGQLPAPAEFLAQLERKAGLPAGGWSPTARFARYRVESFRVAGGTAR